MEFLSMEIKPIRNEADYAAACRRSGSSCAPGTPEADRLDVLVTLVERIEHSITASRRLIR
jgi:antitoxin component HigA of HigAB toxin-antitoxin module